MECKICGADVFQADLKEGICKKCDLKIKSGKKAKDIAEEIMKLEEEIERSKGERQEREKIERQEREKMISEETVNGFEYNFKSLLAYGRTISGVGWVAVVVGGISLLVGSVKSIDNNEFGVLGLMGGLLIGIFGFLIVTMGQMISCFVTIEKNTRGSYELLKEIREFGSNLKDKITAD